MSETWSEARGAGALVCDIPVNRGQGLIFMLGYWLARTRGAKIIATIDADGQFLPSELERVIQPIGEQRLYQGFFVGEMPVHRPCADSGATGDLVQRHVRALGPKSSTGGLKDAVPVAPSVGAQRTRIIAGKGRAGGVGRVVGSSHRTNLLAP